MRKVLLTFSSLPLRCGPNKHLYAPSLRWRLEPDKSVVETARGFLEDSTVCFRDFALRVPELSLNYNALLPFLYRVNRKRDKQKQPQQATDSELIPATFRPARTWVLRVCHFVHESSELPPAIAAPEPAKIVAAVAIVVKAQNALGSCQQSQSWMHNVRRRRMKA